MTAHFEPGPVTLDRPAPSLAGRRIPAGDYEIMRRTHAGNYQLFRPDGGKFAAVVAPCDLAAAARTNAREEGDTTA